MGEEGPDLRGLRSVSRVGMRAVGRFDQREGAAHVLAMKLEADALDGRLDVRGVAAAGRFRRPSEV